MSKNTDILLHDLFGKKAKFYGANVDTYMFKLGSIVFKIVRGDLCEYGEESARIQVVHDEDVIKECSKSFSEKPIDEVKIIRCGISGFEIVDSTSDHVYLRVGAFLCLQNCRTRFVFEYKLKRVYDFDFARLND